MIHMPARECRKRAAECTEIAELQDDLERKREYLELATIWRLIAIESEETEVGQNTLDMKRALRRAPF
jgi:hypothetical protein